MIASRIVYLKKRDLKSHFVSIRRIFAFFTVLVSVQPVAFWYLAYLQLNGSREIFHDIDIQLPFWLEYGAVIAAILVALGLCVAAFTGFSRIPNDRFDNNMSKFDSAGDDELILTRQVTGFTLWMFILPMVSIGILGVAFLYLTVTANADYSQRLQQAHEQILEHR